MNDILIVDDEKDIRELISEILIDEGYSTRLASNSVECLNNVQHYPPSLLILDIWLKDSKMDGIDILKNAGEAIEARILKSENLEDQGVINVLIKENVESVTLEISDNGIGLPPDRSRLFEPYVTTREKGTGLGLAIVKKIIEEHGGVLKLEDAIPFGNSDLIGALISIDLPKSKKSYKNDAE